jgi:rRNA maturation RNase YbeY
VLAFPLPEEEFLGEVVVSMATCLRQALEAGRSAEAELAELVVHGVLHLAGHDHELGRKESAEMLRLQALAMKRLGRL